MPIALFGLIACLALWDVFKFCSNKWEMDRYPLTRQCLVRAGQCGELSVVLCLLCILLYTWAIASIIHPSLFIQ